MIYYRIYEKDLPEEPEYHTYAFWYNYQNHSTDPFVEKIVWLKEEYVDLLNEELQKVIGVKKEKLNLKSAVSLGLKAFLSMTFAGQLIYTAGKLVKDEKLLNGQKKKEFDLFEILDHIDISYVSGFHKDGYIEFGIHDPKWNMRAKWLENGSSKIRRYNLFTKTNKTFEYIYSNNIFMNS